MTGFVVDASICVKWLVQEPGSEAAWQLFESGSTLFAPSLLVAEAANALWTIKRRGAISGDDVQEAMDTLADAGIDFTIGMQQLVPMAVRLSLDLDHPAYDCFYLALALHRQYPVVTDDRRFESAARAHPYYGQWVLRLGALPI